MIVRLTPSLKFHGGKQYLAKRIVALMPPHVHFCEPFFGGGAVLLAKDPEGISEVANDLNGELINFWRVMARPTAFEQFHRMCEATPFSEWHWNNANEEAAALYRFDHGPDATKAYEFFVRCRQSLAGRMGAFAPLSRTRTRRGLNEQASAWITAVDGLPAVHARLRRVVILNRPAIEVIRSQDGPETLYYCDPPYLHETRATTREYGEFEMSEADHLELLDALASISGKFLLSGYASDLYGSYEIRFGWTRHDFNLPNNAASGDTKRRMVECVWANF